MNKLLLSLCGAACFFTTSNAFAADDWEYIPYIGMDYLYSDVNYKASKGVDHNAYHNSGSFNVGTTMGKYFGTELFVQRSDTYKKEIELGVNDKNQFNAYGLDMIGYLPFGCDLKFNLIASFGIGEYHMRSKNRDLGQKKYTDHGFGWRTGLGAQYNFDENWSARMVARHVNFDGIHAADHMMEYTAGIRYYFR